MVRFLELLSSRLLWLNILLAVIIKIVLPFGVGGLANIADTLGEIDLAAVLVGTNEARAQHAMRPLSPNAQLNAAAQAKLDDMDTRGYFGHVNPDGLWPWEFISEVGYAYSLAGENLARGFYDPNRLVQAWMSSDAHRANILNESYTEVGFAAKRIMVNGRSTLAVVQMFAAPRPVAAVPTQPSPAPLNPQVRFEVAGVQAVSTVPEAPTVTEPKTVAAFSEGPAEKAGMVVGKIFGIWLVLIASLSFAIAVLERRSVHLLSSVAHVAILMLLTMTPALRAFSGAIF